MMCSAAQVFTSLINLLLEGIGAIQGPVLVFEYQGNHCVLRRADSGAFIILPFFKAISYNPSQTDF